MFAFLYLRRYRNPYEADNLSFWTSVFALIVVLISSALLPVDIFFVSYMKNVDGSFKEWAASSAVRDSLENSILYSYYALYGVVFICIFIVVPFAYFFFEEREDDIFGSGNSARLSTTIKYTMVFVLVAIVLLLIGAFIPLRETPPSNSTDWEKIEFLFGDLTKNRGEDALSMVLSILSLLGMINLIFYTGFGIFSWPMGLIRGTRSARNQSEEIQEQHLVNQTRINALKDKERIGGRLSARERKQLAKLEDTERQITRQEQLVEEVRGSLWYRCRKLLRPLEISTGIILMVLAFLIWISLLLTNIDKAMNSLGPKMGYTLKERSLPNPIDITLVFMQKIFPLDYLLLFIITWFLVLCTISGIRNLGIRILFVKMYKLRVRRTKPQGLLLTCATLMLTVLAINIFVYCVSPQYATFGSQKFIREDNINGTLASNTTVVPCNTHTNGTLCTMTRNSALLTRFFYKAWFFGAAYYWCTWLFVAVSAISFCYVILRKTKHVTDDLEDEDEIEESDDDELLSRRRSNRVH